MDEREEKNGEEEEVEVEVHSSEERGAETSLLSAVIVPHIKDARNISALWGKTRKTVVKREVLM